MSAAVKRNNNKKMMKKKALITGIAGQDGAYLGRLLLEKGYEVYGTFSRTHESKPGNLRRLGIEERVKPVLVDLLESSNVHATIARVRPDEVYNLGSQSAVGLSFDEPMFTAEVNALGALRILEAIRDVNPRIRFFQAASSEVLSSMKKAADESEALALHPKSPYAVSKIFAHWITVNYRESFGMYACSGFLFNHESPLRGIHFVTRKITSAAARISLGLQKDLSLGNLNPRRDWGYAPDYVEAMWMMLNRKKPNDFVIATGQEHSVRKFVEEAFGAVGVDIAWSGTGVKEVGRDARTGKTLVRVDPKLFRPTEHPIIRAEIERTIKELRWSPRTKFSELVRELVGHDLQEARKELAGKPA